MGLMARLLLSNGRPPEQNGERFPEKGGGAKAGLERAEEGRASGPAASSAEEPVCSGNMAKRVLLLPSFPAAPISKHEQDLVAARRAERGEVEKRLAERAAQLTELFQHFAKVPTQFEKATVRRWEQYENQSARARFETQSGPQEYFLTPDEAWQTCDEPSIWDAYLHRMVQFLILVSGMDRQQEVLKQVATMTIGELVDWYRQCLNVLIWNHNRLFVHPFIVGIGCYLEGDDQRGQN